MDAGVHGQQHPEALTSRIPPRECGTCRPRSTDTPICSTLARLSNDCCAIPWVHEINCPDLRLQNPADGHYRDRLLTATGHERTGLVVLSFYASPHRRVMPRLDVGHNRGGKATWAV